MVYEVSSGTAIFQVEGYCRHLTDAGTFSSTSQPTRAWVTDQLNIEESFIATKLESCGYNSAQSATPVLRFLQGWNVIRTVIAIELANPVEGISGRGNARFQEFVNQEKMYAEVACSPGLEDMGATINSTMSDLLLATGVSKSRKQDVEEDTDFIKHRVRRGQFQNPRYQDPEIIDLTVDGSSGV